MKTLIATASVVALAAGAWTTDAVIDSKTQRQTQNELTELRAENDQLLEEFVALNRQNEELRNLAAASLEFQALFRTGDAVLTEESIGRIERLSRFIAEQDLLQVRLSGFADPRGDAEYNDSLSQARVDTVMQILTENGVEPMRIQSNAFGDRLSVAHEGDYDAYALERRVSIELIPDTSATNLAAN